MHWQSMGPNDTKQKQQENLQAWLDISRWASRRMDAAHAPLRPPAQVAHALLHVPEVRGSSAGQGLSFNFCGHGPDNDDFSAMGQALPLTHTNKTHLHAGCGLALSKYEGLASHVKPSNKLATLHLTSCYFLPECP